MEQVRAMLFSGKRNNREDISVDEYILFLLSYVRLVVMLGLPAGGQVVL